MTQKCSSIFALLGRTVPVALLLSFNLFPPQALAKGHRAGPHSIQGARFDLHFAVDRYSMYGLGGRVEFPIVPGGIAGKGAHDELALSLGADALFAPLDESRYGGGAYALPVAALQWNFYVGSKGSIFPEVGIAAHVDFDESGYGDRERIYPQVDLGFGARYHLNKRTGLLIRIGTPAGLQLGMVF